ncbi:DNA mismatch repair endonuclease MutL [Chitinophaga ginsengisegetis]|uniref:DNA mismatch repair endonuclease MutL n=1 Tax=Chitinophaga ginsengisegetis TaxID=393003 RepID=UPI000DB96A02|nr:DNA mismatch repair endonuclease MutL [Chitinophaga ginsengisegetis]MDR6566273.1 DNA mismatch repair protein MutL [Chitinophaga ginsengisegetis]MDR6646003.1 DNA mismatch repair protein MutL [Chitinophaga ginsengisegetis]MDR6651405.1 DNA mismatch repair protein MutL [Chitinophaga ginsengisegetis]
MADIINLLPDNIANQIAAGEVIQRPASAVKELLENAVDAGATDIQLIIKDAGKELVQVIDNGGGMSETDARMCFERHATSKIQSIEDLFQITTMGFRGEALASIAAVSQVELKTRKKGAELGTYVEIDNSFVNKQEPCQTAEGTSIAMKNLFFNVPARRNFLKSNAAEMRHIVDEFIRVAMSFPQLQFSLTNNNQQLFHLDKGSLKQRIVAILGQHYNARLVSVKETTDYMNVYGFVGKPETAKKTRGDQFFFVNNRFIKSSYLNHAVMNAFADIIPADSFPLYVLFIDVNPEHVDINVHPTKQEIKFDDEKLMYAFVQSAVKHSLAQFSITATLDFDLDPSIQALDAVSKPFTAQQQNESTQSPLYKSFTQANQAHMIDKSSNSSNLKHWKDLYETNSNNESTYTIAPEPETRPAVTYESQPHATASVIDERWQDTATDQKVPVQVHQQYILSQIKSGFILIDQQAAHERILYERYQRALQEAPMATQQSLFPQTLQLPPADAALVSEMLGDLQTLGYDLEPFGNNTFIVRGTPADIQNGNDHATIQNLLEQFKNFSHELKVNNREQLIRSMARNNAIPAGKILAAREMQNIIDELFACSMPNVAPGGKFTFISFKLTDLARMFERGN